MEQALLISSVLLWAVVLFNLLLTLAVVRKVNSIQDTHQVGRRPEPIGLDVGAQAPDFVAETLDGDKVTLATFAGRPTAFIFIMPNCEPCTEGMPDYLSLASKAREAGAELVLVNVGAATATRELVNEFNVTTRMLIAPEGLNPFMSDYKMRGTPSYTYIDANGKIQSTGRPARTLPQWQEIIRSWESAGKELARA
ncbi:MAG: peroxiredoxin family protein [Chloroflexota bacterium]|nr:peroxiredoxin family protein [Chloroflexota bacterium]